MNDPLDDRTAAYILATRRPFEDLRQVASQLAGLLVLAASGAKSASPDHPLLGAARTMFDEAAGDVRRATPSPRAQRHHASFLQALLAIDEALALAPAGLRGGRTGDLDSVLTPLNAGYRHLQDAANCLPGFELVAFSQSCCSQGQAGRVGARRSGGPGGSGR